MLIGTVVSVLIIVKLCTDSNILSFYILNGISHNIICFHRKVIFHFIIEKITIKKLDLQSISIVEQCSTIYNLILTPYSISISLSPIVEVKPLD